MFRQRQGVYQVCAMDSKVKILRTEFDVSQDVGQWRNWIFRFKLSKFGYFEVYRDGLLVGRIAGKTKARRAYLKLGLYAQQMNPPGVIVSTSFCDSFL